MLSSCDLTAVLKKLPSSPQKFSHLRRAMPTRNGRNAMLFTYQGTMNKRNKKREKDFSPVDPDGCEVNHDAAFKAKIDLVREISEEVWG